MISWFAQTRKSRRPANNPRDRDTQGVAGHVHDRAMTVQLDCPWCQDEIAFEVDETAEELVCSECGIRTEFAPDPVATFGLLYDAA